jgi:alpha-N-acetylglucosamine transferase
VLQRGTELASCVWLQNDASSLTALEEVFFDKTHLYYLDKNHTQTRAKITPRKQGQVYHQTCTEALGKKTRKTTRSLDSANPIYRNSLPSVTTNDEPEAANGVDLIDP